MDISRRYVLAAGPALAAGGAARAVNAAEFGLEPDAARDQSRALQSAIDRAATQGFDLILPPGAYRAAGLKVGQPVSLIGSPGRTTLVSPRGDRLLTIAGTGPASLYGLAFDGASQGAGERHDALVAAEGIDRLLIDTCAFLASLGTGLSVTGCAGRVIGSRFGFIAKTGLFALDSKGLEISGNHVHDIGNNGIQVWASESRDDGAIVANNRIERVAARAGGSGQNGNGINVWKAGNVLIAHNRVTDCAFSAIRDNAGSNCRIIANSCSRIDETAIYVEFAFEGAVVMGNLVDDAAMGISITNLDVGGRLATCANNVLRALRGGGSNPEKSGVGIHAEADAAIVGNVIDQARDIGISLGFGPYCRNLSATGNVLRDCGVGLTVSLSEGAEPALIAHNLIAAAKRAAILGMDRDRAVTTDLGAAGAAIPARLMLRDNLVT